MIILLKKEFISSNQFSNYLKFKILLQLIDYTFLSNNNFYKINNFSNYMKKRLSKLLMSALALTTIYATNSLGYTPSVDPKLAKEAATLLEEKGEKRSLFSRYYGAGAVYNFGTRQKPIYCDNVNDTRIFAQFFSGSRKQSIEIHATSPNLKKPIEITDYFMTGIIDKCDANNNNKNCKLLYNLALNCIKQY